MITIHSNQSKYTDPGWVLSPKGTTKEMPNQVNICPGWLSRGMPGINFSVSACWQETSRNSVPSTWVLSEVNALTCPYFSHAPGPTVCWFCFGVRCLCARVMLGVPLFRRLILLFAWLIFFLPGSFFLPHHSTLIASLCIQEKMALPKPPPNSLAAYRINFWKTVLDKFTSLI